MSSPAPSIHIGRVYVYNFASPASSSGPFCRICHEGEAAEALVAPCRCTGSVGLVHKSCMERWLSTRCAEDDVCEICNYAFSTVRSPKSLGEWLRSGDVHRRNLLGDVLCFVLLTPLAGASSFLCVEGARRQVEWGNSLEAGCLMALATFLVTIYLIWNLLTFRYHTKSYLRWRSRNHHVKLVKVQRRSAANDDPAHATPDTSSVGVSTK